MLKHGEANPLNVFGLRELDFCPPHFQRVEFDQRTSDVVIKNWIYENLSGRFFHGQWVNQDADVVPTKTLSKCVAFEEHHEASYFLMNLETFNVSNW